MDTPAAHADLERIDEAFERWEEVSRRFGKIDAGIIHKVNQVALFGRAYIELTRGRARAAIDIVNEALGPGGASEFIESLCQGHLVRAVANLKDGNDIECLKDAETALEALPTLGYLSQEAIHTLSALAFDLGMPQLRQIIQASSSAAVDNGNGTGIGLEPKVAKEVREVAEDLRDQW